MPGYTRSRVRAGKESLPEEEDLGGSGFVLREVGRWGLRAWVLFQLAGLLAQWQLWREVGRHLDRFELALEEQCRTAGSHHGVCLGPMWNLSSWQETALEGWGAFRWCQQRAARVARHPAGGARRHGRQHWRASPEETCRHPSSTNFSFAFSTRSRPPTFLVVVAPLPAGGGRRPNLAHGASTSSPPPAAEAEWEFEDYVEWSLEVARTEPPPVSKEFDRHLRRKGHEALTFEDLSEDAARAMEAKGRIDWRATVSNHGASQARLAVFVEDSTVPRSLALRSGKLCSFTRSWKAFNQQHQGRSHSALAMCRVLLGMFLPITALAIYAVSAVHLHQLRRARQQRDGGSSCFHCIVITKFLVVDAVQQACIVLYVLGWYEADGLRCQLCLFQQEECEDARALGLPTVAALGCSVLSCLANQLLVRPARKHRPAEDGACSQWCARVAAASVSTLPVTTGVYWASSALMSAPAAAQVLVFAPCVLGWITLAGLAFCFVTACCEDCR